MRVTWAEYSLKSNYCICGLHGVLLFKFSFGTQVSEKFTTSDVRHKEVEIASVLRESDKSNLVLKLFMSGRDLQGRGVQFRQEWSFQK